MTHAELRAKATNEVGDIVEHMEDCIMGNSHDTGICVNGDCTGTIHPLETDARCCVCPECGKTTVHAICLLVETGYLP